MTRLKTIYWFGIRLILMVISLMSVVGFIYDREEFNPLNVLLFSLLTFFSIDNFRLIILRILKNSGYNKLIFLRYISGILLLLALFSSGYYFVVSSNMKYTLSMFLIVLFLLNDLEFIISNRNNRKDLTGDIIDQFGTKNQNKDVQTI